MRPYKLNDAVLARIRELIEANFASRDELYAAAETLDDESMKKVCRRLADHLAGHAVELQQIAAARIGDSDVDVDTVEFIDYVSAQAFLEMVKEVHGPERVIAAAEQCEQNLKAKYDRVIDETSHSETEGVFQRHRSEIEFGERVLHSMRTDPEGETSGS